MNFLADKTPQEVFNTAYHFIVAQGTPAINKSGDCVYDGPNGTTCAAGCLVSEDERRKLPSQLWYEKLATGPIGIVKELPQYSGPHNTLIRCIQIAHDDAAGYRNFVENFRHRMHRLAVKYNLTVPTLE